MPEDVLLLCGVPEAGLEAAQADVQNSRYSLKMTAAGAFFLVVAVHRSTYILTYLPTVHTYIPT
jgi:hypothetical protein